MARERKPNSDAGLEERVELARWVLYAGYPMFGAILGPFRGSFWTQFWRKRKSSSERWEKRVELTRRVKKRKRESNWGDGLVKRVELGRGFAARQRTTNSDAGLEQRVELARRVFFLQGRLKQRIAEEFPPVWGTPPDPADPADPPETTTRPAARSQGTVRMLSG